MVIGGPMTAAVLAMLSIVLLVVSTHRLRHLALARRVIRRTLRTNKSRPSSEIVGVAAIVAAGTAIIFAPKLIVVVVPVTVLTHRIVNAHLRDRSASAYQRDLPVVLEQLAGSVRSGANLFNALEDVAERTTGPVARDLRLLVTRVSNGARLDEALELWERTAQSVNVRLATSSMLLAQRSGAAHAQVIDGVVMTLRRNQQSAASARVHASQSTASAWALTLLPVVFTGSMVAIDAETREFLFDTWIGVAVLGAGLTLDVVGLLWMKRLIQRAVQL